jgi:hypothetical protein
MKVKNYFRRRVVAAGGLCGLLCASVALIPATPRHVAAAPFSWWRHHHTCEASAPDEEVPGGELGGSWYWMRSPEQENRVVMALFNRYCVRCHGVDGRGVWDIPDVPNFTNPLWQSHHTDGQLARAILEGRGSVMPPWRGVLSLEEAWAMARHVRTFVPGAEISRPDFSTPPTPGPAPQQPAEPKTPLKPWIPVFPVQLKDTQPIR